MSNESQHESGRDEQTVPTGMRARLVGSRYARMVQGDGLRARALRGSGWTVAGFGASQVLRLGSNLILTRLLFPEAFGLMTLAQVFLTGLNMLSDIGVGPSIVQNKRGDDPDFLATAWTLQVLRGLALFLGMCVVSYPVSLIYDEPLLFPILMLIGLTALTTGLQSIGMATANRKMSLGKLTTIDLISQGTGIFTMVVWAAYHPTVWALVGGGVLASVVRVGLGHRLLPSAGNHFRFERSAASEIFHFGKWIFVATAFTYFGGEGLRLIQGYMVPMDTLGIISIAGMLAMVTNQLIVRVGGMVLFPALAHIHLERPEELVHKLRESRTKLFLISLPIFLVLIVLGRDLIALMYDDRYLSAGVYLVIMATSASISSQRTPFGMVLIATGDSFGHAVIMFVRAIARMGAVYLGFTMYGIEGMLIADIAAQGLIYPFEAWRLHKRGLWMPMFDVLVSAGFLAIGWLSYSTGPYFFVS